MISFIATYRNRNNQLEEFIKSLDKYYPSSEIVIAEQKNEKAFVQGQLFNLAYPHSHGDMIVLMDIDMRYTKKVDFLESMNKLKHPFIGYNQILNCNITGKISGIRNGSSISLGGCSVFTRSQFEASSGYSNLMCGWGGEDDILNIRVNGFKRIDNTLLHIDHSRRNIGGQDHDINVRLYKTERERNKELDGFRQTVGNLVYKEVKDNVMHLGFDGIGVVPTFVYKNLLRISLQ